MLLDENETDEWEKQRDNHRSDNEGDDNNDDDHGNNDNNKVSRSSPILNRFLDSDGDGVDYATIMTTGIGEDDEHGPGDASVTI